MDYKDYTALIMENISTVCYICDVETYEMLYMTRTAMDVCGLERPEDYQKQKCYKILQGLDAPCPFCNNAKLAENREYRWEHHNEKLSRWFDITDKLIQIEGHLCRLETAKDITARKEEISPSFGRLTMEDILFRCLNTLAREKDLNTAVNLFLEAIGGYYQAARAYIFEFDLKQQTLSNTFEWCRTGVTAEIDNLQELPLEVVSDWIRKFKISGEMCINSLHDEIDRDSEEYRILEMQGIQSLLAVPLLRNEEIVGFIGVDDPEQNAGNMVLLRSVSEFVFEELEKRRLMAELEYMSYIDTLTGLRNRNQYAHVLRKFETNPPNTLGVIALDINGLKEVNDAHGYEYGDHVLKRTAEILQKHFSQGMYRVDGDEFVVLCTELSKEEFQNLVVTLRDAFDADETCDISIGCAWNFDANSVDVNALIQQANEIRGAEKQSYYHTVLNEGRSISRTGFASEVLQEIEDNRFIVYYQPQVDIKTGKVVGAEALVRKKGDDGKLVSPGKFIPFYEIGGVISHVDLFVMRTACATLRKWLDQGHDLHIAVNFSRITLLEPYIVEVISGICAEYNVPPSSITIEVTESIGKMNNEQLKELIKKLKAAGFSISLDDFGSQYSNLAILAAMDFDEVKFDRSLVSSLEENAKSRIVIKSGMDLCRELEGTASLAEGIETKSQLDLLLQYYCDYGQGYLFSKPISQEDFEVYLKQHMKNKTLD